MTTNLRFARQSIVPVKGSPSMTGSQAQEDQYEFQFVAAPDDISPYLNSLYIWNTTAPDFHDALPAYSGQLVSFVEGSGQLISPNGGAESTSDGFFLAPLLEAQRFQIAGPARCFGVSLNFRGWAALTNLPVTNWHDCMFELENGLESHLAERFRALAPAWRAGKIDNSGMFDAMAQIVREGLRKLPEQHATLIDKAHDWLSSSFNPRLEDLYASLPYSERQVQRLVARFFGQSPIRLIRRYRAVRAATLLSFPSLPDTIETAIHEAFYDQAHMIKEIRYFTGRTPKRLVPIANSLMSDMLAPDGYSSVDPYAGIEAMQLGTKPEDL